MGGISEFQNYFIWLTMGNFRLLELFPLTHILEGICFHYLRGSYNVLLNSFLLLSSFSSDNFYCWRFDMFKHAFFWHLRIHVEQLNNLKMIQTLILGKIMSHKNVQMYYDPLPHLHGPALNCTNRHGVWIVFFLLYFNCEIIFLPHTKKFLSPNSCPFYRV